MKSITLIILICCVLSMQNAKSQCSATENSGAYSINNITNSSGSASTDVKISTFVSELNKIIGSNAKAFYYNDAYSPNAQASPEDNNIYIGRTFLSQSLRSDPSFTGIYLLIAHEMGHIYQFTTNNRLVKQKLVKQCEIQADYLAGHLLAKTKKVSNSNYQSLIEAVNKMGDFGFNSIQHHGTPGERENAVNAGFRNQGYTLEKIYDDSDFYASRHINPVLKGSIVYVCRYYNGLQQLIIYQGKIVQDVGRGIQQVGQMVTVDVTDQQNQYMFKFNFSMSGSNDIFVDRNLKLYNQYHREIGEMIKYNNADYQGENEVKQTASTPNSSDALRMLKTGWENLSTKKTADGYQSTKMMRIKNNSKKTIILDVEFPYGYYKGCDDKESNFVEEGYVSDKFTFKPLEERYIRVVAKITSENCKGVLSKLRMFATYE